MQSDSASPKEKKKKKKRKVDDEEKGESTEPVTESTEGEGVCNKI